MERYGRIGQQVPVKREEEELVCRCTAVSSPGEGSLALGGSVALEAGGSEVTCHPATHQLCL